MSEDIERELDSQDRNDAEDQMEVANLKSELSLLREQLKTARGLLETIEIEIKNGYLHGSAVYRIREALSNLNGTKEEEHG